MTKQHPIKTVTKEFVRYSQNCNVCNKEILGSTKSMLEWNMLIHIQSQHKKKETKK